MPELFSAMYQGRQICIFDIQDKNGQYIEEIRSEFRRASQSNALYCPDCNGVLELCAGAVVAPYFRHKSVLDCPASREMKTEAGKRMYFGKRMLYEIGKTAKEGFVSFHEGKTDLPFHPILLRVNQMDEAFIYLDGNSRNYQEMMDAKRLYEEKKIKTRWFLHKKYQSNSNNLTSNEAEASIVNGGIIYYLDTKNQTIEFRKSYQRPYGGRAYYTEAFSIDKIVLEEDGEFCSEFLEHYNTYVKEQKKALDRVLRVPIEDGIEEVYFDFTYAYMDAIDEIWVLPKLKMPFEDRELNEEVNLRREAYLVSCNELFSQLTPYQRKREAAIQIEYLNWRNIASNWI